MHNLFLSACIVLAAAACLSGCGHQAPPANPNTSAGAPIRPGGLQAPPAQQARLAHINAMRDAARRAHMHARASQ